MAFSDIGVFSGNLIYRAFNHFTSHPMETQQKTLETIMKRNKNCELGKKYDFANIHTLREFQDKVPLSTFDDYAPLIDRMVAGNQENVITGDKIVRYCSSSGSVGKPKLQPKTARDLTNLQGMSVGSTCACVLRYFKEKEGMKKLPALMGPMLISLNGHTLPNGMQCNGAGQVPFTYMTKFIKYFSTTPLDILYPEDEENTDIQYFQLRFSLINRDVTYLFSVVITLLSTMFEYLENNWEMLCDDIEHGTIDPSVRCPASLREKYGHMKPDPVRAQELRAEFRKGFDTDVPIVKRIWPKCFWGFGMTGSTLSVYSEKLKRYIGDLPMHNMGYGASEGFLGMAITLNTEDSVLLPRSLIYEFLPEDAPEGTRPLFMDQLEVGKNYEIIITNFSGLYRYRLLDIVRVTGYHNKTPMVEFLYRSNMGLNIANEKTTTQMLDFVADQIDRKFNLNLKGYSYYADTDAEHPCYTLLCETDSDVIKTNNKEIVDFMDQSFRDANEKYFKYRRWGMIGDPVILQLEDGTYDAYKASLVAKGVVLNQIKPVTVINTPEKKEFFFSRIKK